MLMPRPVLDKHDWSIGKNLHTTLPLAVASTHPNAKTYSCV